MEAKLRTKLLSGAAAVALLSLVHTGDARAQGPIGTPIPTFDLFIEGGYLVGDPDTNGLAYAENRLTKSAFSIDPGDGWTGRLGAAAHFRGPWSARLMYTGLAASKGGRTPDVANNAVLGVGQFPVATVLPNGSFIPGVGTTWNQAHVHTTARAGLLDLQAGYDVGLGGGVQTTVLGGMRYAEFSQSTDATFFNVRGVPEVVNFRKSAFHGIGPELGAKASVPVFGSFSVEGSILGSLLFGHLDSKSSGNFISFAPLLSRNVNSNRTAGTVDGQLALTYRIPLGPVESIDLAAGYQVFWLAGVRDTRNGASGPSFASFLINDGARFGRTNDDLLFHGPFMRLGWHW